MTSRFLQAYQAMRAARIREHHKHEFAGNAEAVIDTAIDEMTITELLREISHFDPERDA